MASKFIDWNERMGRQDLSNEQISYLLYLVAADIADSNLESDTPRWFFRGPVAEASSGAAVRVDQAGVCGPD